MVNPWIVALLSFGSHATMFMGRIDTTTTWLGDATPGFFHGFTAREQQAYFYPREYLNDKPVTFMMMEGSDFPEIAQLEKMCAGAVDRGDFIVHELLRESDWKVDNLHDANFVFLPTFAGVVLDGQCSDKAEMVLRTYLHKMYLHPLFNKAHGHTMIMYGSTEAVNEVAIKRIHAIAKQRYRYDLPSFQQAMTDANGIPPEFLDYMMSQTILIDRFYRPTLQYCQLFAPPILQNPTSLEVSHSSLEDFKTPTVESWRASRPIKFLMVDQLILDDPKYAARQAAFRVLPDKFPGVYKVIQREEDARLDVMSSKCEDEQSSKCTVTFDSTSMKNSTLELRKQLLAQTQFVVVTRGEYPHEEVMYQAIEAGAIIINTIDKTMDMAAPFQCQVPWEEFTIRIGSEAFKKDPEATLQKALDELTDEQLLKMIKLTVYFSPDLLVNPAYGQQNRWVHNVMLNAVRRCTTEQVIGSMGFTGLNTQCPFSDWAKQQLVMRTVFNVDTPPWFEL